MVRRPVAWIVTVVLFAEALGIAAVNWFLGVVADRQQMSLAGVDPDAMATSSKIGAVVFGLYFALCGVAALLVATRDRSPRLVGRILLISAAVVHGLLAAVAWGMLGVPQFLFLVVVLALIVLLLMTYDGREGTAGTPAESGSGDGGAPEPGARPEPGAVTKSGAGPEPGAVTKPGAGPEPGREPQDLPPAPVTPPAPTTP